MSKKHILKSANICYCSSLHNSILIFLPEIPMNCTTSGSVFLTGGTSESEGTVQLCYNNEWGTVCDIGWSDNDADVVCQQLGYLSEWQEMMLYINACHILTYL